MKLTETEMYLDWVNNFLTVARFAEYYGISKDKAYDIIQAQRLGFQSANEAKTKGYQCVAGS